MANFENEKKQKLLPKIRKNLPGWLLILPTLILFFLIVWRPIVIAFSYSFFKLKGFTPMEFVGLKNFIDVVTDTNFLRTLGNTILYVFWSLLIGFPLPFIAAVMMNENKDYGIPVPDYIEENVSTKVVKIIQSYTGVVNKMVWRKF